MKRNIGYLILGWAIGGIYSPNSSAATLALSIGPPAIGIGGSNAVGIPPQISDLGISFITEEQFEFHLGISGVFVGRRQVTDWGGYFSLGGGPVLSANGFGIGPYSLFGYQFLRSEAGYSTFIEYLQAVGIGSRNLVSPYVVRIGIGKWI